MTESDQVFRDSIRNRLVAAGITHPESHLYTFDHVVDIVDDYMRSFFANVTEIKVRKSGRVDAD